MATFELLSASSEILAIHAALLPIGAKGKVIIFGGDEHNQAQAGRDATPAIAANVDNTRIYDVDAQTITYTTSPTTDVFCSGHAFLGDGRLVIGGGTESWEGGGGPGGGHGHVLGNFGGHQACWIYNHLRNNWERIADFNFDDSFGKTGGGRWYPTLVTLSNGDLIAFSGHPSRRSISWHNNNIPERYSPGGNWHWIKPTTSEIDFYPRIYLIKGGLLFICVVEDGSTQFYNPITGNFEGPPIPGPGSQYGGWNSSSVLLPLLPNENYRCRVLMCDDTDPKKIDLEAAIPSWQNTSPRTGAAAGRIRKFGIATILPDGKVLVFGGVGDSNLDSTKVLEPEIYEPGINWNTGIYSNPDSWQSLAADPNGIARNYHSTNLLLPDGSIFTAGSSHDSNPGDPATVGEMRIVIFKPDYFDNPARPTLSSIESHATYNQQITINTPDAGTIQRVALIRNGSTTHAFNPDQRYIGLNFNLIDANTLRATIPGDSTVLPPGYYMLWIINNAGLPCRLAKFIRIGFQHCEIITDRSTFSVLEVDAQPAGAAIFQNAFYVVYDGFLPSELNNFATAPTLTFTAVSNNATISDMSAIHVDTLYEDPSLPPDVPQKVTFVFNVRFTSNAAFSFPELSKDVRITASLFQHACQAIINLIKAPNPYMVDGATSWLSVDLRVFQMRQNGPTRATIAQGSSGTAFITQLLDRFNDRAIYPGDELHPFNDINTNQNASQLEWLETSGGVRVFNYAVAKVRYKAPIPVPPSTDNDAVNVKVFFRMFNTAGTAMQYNAATSYARAGTGVNTISVVGKEGGLISSIPFFADPRVDYSTALMSSQIDSRNMKSLPAKGNVESVVYFGCWLDFNQPGQSIPFTEDATHATSLVNLQTSIRGIHQCLVAEVYFEGDPTPANATPGSSDNLSQRNLAIAHSDNPGSLATHIVQHTFEIRPSQFFLPKHFIPTDAGDSHNMTHGAVTGQRSGPDLLMIHWNNLPKDSKVIVYLPDVPTDDILALETYARFSPTKITKEDEHTFSFKSADVNYIPVPGGFSKNLPGLLTVELPSTVVKGQLFKVLVQQARYYNNTRRIIGSFQFNIRVSTAALILKNEIRNLSILKYVRQSLSIVDPWRLIFDRYIGMQSDKVDGLGGDSDSVPATSNDKWLWEPDNKIPSIGALIELFSRCCKRTSLLLIIAILILLVLAVFLFIKLK
ncbi:MAG TPA: galactose oxidase early set domain-containing protein [Chitinophagaceae bacterium]